MIRRKRLLAFLMALCCLLTMSIGTFAASTQQVQVDFNGNGGQFQVVNDSRPTDGFGRSLNVGTTPASEGISFGDPVYWDSARAFEGWLVGKYVNKSDSQGNRWTEFQQLSGTGLMTTADVLAYTIPAESIVFQAKWAGDDADYYNQVQFNGYGGQFTYERCPSQNNWVTETSEFWGNDLKIASSGQTFAQQTQGYLRNMQNPVRTDGASFEGWLEFKKVEKINDEGNRYDGFDLVSNTIYTTAQVFNRYVPNYDVAYVAKWSTIPVDCYFVTQNVQFVANGGTMNVTINGQAQGSWEHWGMGCYVGNSPKTEGFSIPDPVYWDSARAFDGWAPCQWQIVTDGDGNSWEELVQIPGTSLLTTAQVLNYKTPNHQIIFQAKWAGNDDDYNSQVYIHGYGERITWDVHYGDNQWREEKGEVWGDYLKENGQSFETQTQDWLRFKAEPSRPDASFEGWLEFEVIETVDAQGVISEEYKLVSNTIYTTAQMLAKPVPSYDVAYVAKWSDIENYEYFANIPEYDVNFQGNGGDVTVTWKGVTETFGGWGRMFKEGKTLAKNGVSAVSATYWTNRAFEGWRVYKEVIVSDNEGNTWFEMEEIPGVGLLSNTDVLNYVVPDHHVVISAQWAGNDDDYNSQVNIEGYGAEVAFLVSQWNNGQETWVDQEEPCWGAYLKENGQSFETQTQEWMKFKAEPSRPDAAFEGWAEFKMTFEENSQGEEMVSYELVSDTLYTTAQMLAKPVPSYDVVYAAKWSDIPLNKYFKDDSNNFPRMTVAGNGGGIFFEVEDENGNVEEGSIEACQYPVEDGQSIKQLLATGMGPELNDMRRPGYKFTGWTLYECEDIGIHGVPTGTDPGIGDPDIEVIYMMCSPDEEANGALYDYYAILEYPTIVDADMTTAELYNFVGTKYYFAKANWKEDDSALRVDMTQGLTTVPSTIANQYPTVASVEDALKDATKAANSSFKDDNMTITYMDVELKIQKEDGTWEVVTYENFPTEGMYILLPYPEGTKGKGFDFVVAHMITGGEKAGQVEILEHTETENGLSVKVTSLSPISIAYKESAKTSSGGGSSSSTGRPMVSPGTGDASMTMLFAAAMVSSAAVLTGVRRKKNK